MPSSLEPVDNSSGVENKQPTSGTKQKHLTVQGISGGVFNGRDIYAIGKKFVYNNYYIDFKVPFIIVAVPAIIIIIVLLIFVFLQDHAPSDVITNLSMMPAKLFLSAFNSNKIEQSCHSCQDENIVGKVCSPLGVNNVFLSIGGVNFLHPNHYQDQLSEYNQIHRVICVHGIWGSGGPTLVRAEALRTNSPYALRFEIEADSDKSLFEGLGDLYRAFYGDKELDSLYQENKTGRLLSGLRAGISRDCWRPAALLLINCQQGSIFLNEVLNALPEVGFLLTTERKELLYPRGNVAYLPLNEGWNLTERLLFMEAELGSSKALEGSKALVKDLPYPSLLKMATQTIKYFHRTNPDWTAAFYLSIFKKGLIDEYEVEALKSTGEDISCRQPLQLERMMGLIKSQEGQVFLQCLGYLASLPVPFSFLRDYFARLFHQEKRNDREQLLLSRAYHEVKDLLSKESVGRGLIKTLRIETMVQDVARSVFPFSDEGTITWQREEINAVQVLSDTLVAAIKVDEHPLNDQHQREQLKNYLSHLERFLEHRKADAISVFHAHFHSGNAYFVLNQTKKAQDAYQNAFKIEGHYGLDHCEAAITDYNSAEALLQLGDVSEKASYYFWVCYTIFEKNHGPGNAQTRLADERWQMYKAESEESNGNRHGFFQRFASENQVAPQISLKSDTPTDAVLYSKLSLE